MPAGGGAESSLTAAQQPRDPEDQRGSDALRSDHLRSAAVREVDVLLAQSSLAATCEKKTSSLTGGGLLGGHRTGVEHPSPWLAPAVWS